MKYQPPACCAFFLGQPFLTFEFAFYEFLLCKEDGTIILALSISQCPSSLPVSL